VSADERRVTASTPTGTVTFVLTDVAGSTQLWEADRVAMSQAIARHYQIIDEVVAKHAGVRPVEQGEGDSTVSAFARTSDAVRAALDIQHAVVDEAWPGRARISIRIGIHVGEAELRSDGNYAGAALNRCARLRSIGHGGQTLLSRAAADLVHDDLPDDAWLKELGEHSLRGLARTEHVSQLCHPALPTDFPSLNAPGPQSRGLPVQLTSFIGREQEMDDVVRLLGESRLVTLVGAGGCGKTRLAIEAVATVTERYRDGALWIDLSSLTDPGLVPSTVVRALNIGESLMQDPTDTVATYLAPRNLLLLMDNCEHLATACASFIERVLRACSELAVLATSREPLGVDGETAWRVPSLTIPSAGAGDVEETESVRLFVDRARKSRPQFRLTEDTVDAIASICRRLDGIPLAIELAAARVRAISPQQVAAGIRDRFSLLGGSSRTSLPRQRTLEASVDWSYNLLSEPERVLFRRLAIFAGGFTLEAAERVCTGADIDEFAVLELLSQLVDRSLVQMEENDDDTRYRLLEPVRVYARQKLADTGEAPAIRDRHRAFFVEFVERAEPGLETPAMLQWVGRLQRDHDNIRAAIDWSVESRDTDWALRVCAASFFFWLYGNHFPEGRRRIDQILALDDGDPGLRARALICAAGTALFLFEEPERSRDLAKQALALARDLDDGHTIGRGLAFLALLGLWGGGSEGRGVSEDAIAATEASGDVAFLCMALSALVLSEALHGERKRAHDAAQHAVEVGRASGHPAWRAQTLAWAGFRALVWGELATAESLYDESISAGRSYGEHWFLSFGLPFRGFVKTLSGRHEDARRDLEDAMTIARPAGLFFQVAIADVVAAERCYALRELEQGAASAEEAVAILRMAEFPFGIAWALTIGAFISEAQQNIGLARSQAEEALELSRENGLPYTEGRALLAIARIEHADGSIDRAEDVLHQALSAVSGSGLPMETIMALEHIAAIAYEKESLEESARLFGAVQAARDLIGYPRTPIRLEEYEASITSVRRALGDDGFEAAWKEGTELSLDEAVAYATRARGERKRPSHGWTSLTPTELHVVVHVREGLTSPQIAERMFISPDTVRTHLKHVFVKLGVSTRAELAAEAVRRGL
jgi:predicted ATPase/class 3 adenylate cyclase/DNA-binding CsgD family transcriptional regulator